jgi:hypothetical protein
MRTMSAQSAPVAPTSCHRAMVDFAQALDALARMLRDD